MDRYIERIVETDDLEKLNKCLDDGYVLINSYVRRNCINDICYEELIYSIGRRNKDRFLNEEVMDNL